MKSNGFLHNRNQYLRFSFTLFVLFIQSTSLFPFPRGCVLYTPLYLSDFLMDWGHFDAWSPLSIIGSVHFVYPLLRLFYTSIQIVLFQGIANLATPANWPLKKLKADLFKPHSLFCFSFTIISLPTPISSLECLLYTTLYWCIQMRSFLWNIWGLASTRCEQVYRQDPTETWCMLLTTTFALFASPSREWPLPAILARLCWGYSRNSRRWCAWLLFYQAFSRIRAKAWR